MHIFLLLDDKFLRERVDAFLLCMLEAQKNASGGQFLISHLISACTVP